MFGTFLLATYVVAMLVGVMMPHLVLLGISLMAKGSGLLVYLSDKLFSEVL